jgi:hypothetical protein
MTWRNDVSDKAQGELDSLFSQAAMLAQTLLMRNREFFPFGATISTKGALGLSTPVPESSNPTVQDVLDSILAELEQGKTSNRAFAVTALARTADGAEAVRIELEHKEGLALVIGLPIVRTATGAVTYGEMRAIPSEPRVWPARAAKATKAKSTRSTSKSTTKATAKSTKAKTPAKSASKASARAPRGAKAANTAKTPAKQKSTSRSKPKSKPRGAAVATA